MATIDLIVLGILKKESLSAYDIQKIVEYRNISKWVKISTPSIYKKVIQLEKKGFMKGDIVKEGNMKTLKGYIEENVSLKEHLPEIPKTGMAVLEQQLILAQALETWIEELKETL